MGYLVGKRIFERKLRRRAEFLKKTTGTLTETMGTEWIVGILIFGLILAATRFIALYIPVIGPCLEKMETLKYEQELDYEDHFDPY